MYHILPKNTSLEKKVFLFQKNTNFESAAFVVWSKTFWK